MKRTTWMLRSLYGQLALSVLGVVFLQVTGSLTFANVLFLGAASSVFVDMAFLVIKRVVPGPVSKPDRRVVFEDLQRASGFYGVLGSAGIVLMAGAAHVGETQLAWCSAAVVAVCAYRLMGIAHTWLGFRRGPAKADPL